MDNSTQFLYVQWDRPASGLTNEDINSYRIVCSAQHYSTEYDIQTEVDNSTLDVALQINRNFLHLATFNCCVEAVFETYSCLACSSVMFSRGCSSDQNSQIRLTNAKRSYVLFASLSALIILLLLSLLTTSIMLRNMLRYIRSKPNQTRYADLRSYHYYDYHCIN